MAAEAAVSFAVEMLGNLLIEKAVFLQGVEGQVKWLKCELRRMQCLLKDAGEKQSHDSRIRNWISEIRDVAQDAQDAIEMFILNVESAGSSRGPLEKCACFPDRVYHLSKVGEAIESIKVRLGDIEKGRLAYGIDGGGLSRRSDEVELRRRVAHWQSDKDVVGLERDVEVLLEKVILDGREGLSVAAVEGMGGIGKSTLARMVYNHIAVADAFECRAWVVVSSEFTPEDVIRQIMMQLRVSYDGGLTAVEAMPDKLRRQEILKEKLFEYLLGKTYFIVLDDVWEQTHWEALESAFPDHDIGGRLLLTSRNQVITKYTGYVHKMKLLGPKQSNELFLKKAFIDNSDGKLPEELESIGVDILRKCNGLPLAITMTGGILLKQPRSKSGWEKVLNELNSHLDRSGGKICVSSILELSYQNLPPELKACFLCFAFFKEDAIIRASKLVHIWVAQDLVPHEVVGRKETMEDIARGYLDELINRNMVQVKESKDNRVKTCHVHDLLRSLSIRKAKEEINFEIISDEGSPHSLDKPRHRAVLYSRSREDFVFSITRNQHLRTLFIHGSEFIIRGGPSSYWKSFELLKILYFEDCELEKLSIAVGGLIGLRYLGFGNSIIWKLPDSLSKLKNLQVLDSRNSVIKLYKLILKMDGLRHLYAHSIVSDMPLNLETIKNLQTLCWFVLNDSNLEQVTQMTGLCKLGAYMDEVTDVGKVLTSLAKLENLVCLKLRNCVRNLEGLGALHLVTQLRLDGWMRRLPSAGDFPPNLAYLSLIDTKLGKDPMSVIEKLPKLLYLKLRDSYRGEEMVISEGGFPRLREIYLEETVKLSNIRVGIGAMQEIKQFEICRCPYLNIESLPQHLKSAITIIDVGEQKAENKKKMNKEI